MPPGPRGPDRTAGPVTSSGQAVGLSGSLRRRFLGAPRLRALLGRAGLAAGRLLGLRATEGVGDGLEGLSGLRGELLSRLGHGLGRALDRLTDGGRPPRGLL